MKNKKGFTLIELLAVIIILGILMLIAIPSVTAYINNSRKNAYLSTIRDVIRGTVTLVNSGDINANDENATYYIPHTCVDLENGKARSPFGEFVKAYVAVTMDEDGYEYYWVSVDETGQGVKELVASKDLSVEKIEASIDPEEISTEVGIGSKQKIFIYNYDCTSTREVKGAYTITFKAGDGLFSNNTKTNVVTIPRKISTVTKTITKYSHTQNINDEGTKLSNYQDNWDNTNITGTDRGSIDSAHVVKIDGASSLTVRITWGGESASWDWACMWEGSHPDYTAYDDYSSSLTGKLGGGNATNSSNTREYTVQGDTVTFSYYSDYSNNGDGYGYYAVVVGEGTAMNTEGEYRIPSINSGTFTGWLNQTTNQLYTDFNSMDFLDDYTYIAQYDIYSTLTVTKPSAFNSMKINGVSTSGNTSFVGHAGETLTYGDATTTTISTTASGYSVAYDYNGGDQSNTTAWPNKYKRGTVTFNGYSFTGNCGTYTSTTGNGTYTFPSGGGTCTLSPLVNVVYPSEWTQGPTTLKSNATRSGYTFAGWLCSTDGQIHAAGESYTPTENTTMTAQWTAN